MKTNYQFIRICTSFQILRGANCILHFYSLPPSKSHTHNTQTDQSTNLSFLLFIVFYLFPDFENAAFTVFVALVTRVVLAFDLALYIPLSKVGNLNPMNYCNLLIHP